MGKVRWTHEARDDLRDIHRFVQRDSPRAAEVLVARLLESARRLESFPRSGRVVPEFADVAHREIILGSYRVIYRLEGNVVWIVGIAHGRQQIGRR